jgi:hypothetical protein
MHTPGHHHRVEIFTLITAFGLGSLLSLVTGCSSPAAAALPPKETAPLAPGVASREMARAGLAFLAPFGLSFVSELDLFPSASLPAVVASHS